MAFRENMQRITARPLQLWLLLFVAVTLLYLPAWKGGFQQDFQGWIELYHKSFGDMLNRVGSPVHSLYQLTQLQLYLWTRLFGIHPLPWFLLFTGLHALNGTLLYRLCSRVLADFGFANAGFTALAGALLVLLNPSMTEVVLWKAAYHYLIGVQAVLWMLIWAREYLLSGDRKWVWQSLLLIVLLVFTLELWYTIPALIMLMAVAYWQAAIITKARFLRVVKTLALPLLSVFTIYLFTYRILYGTWFAHNAYTIAGDDSPFILAGRIWSYEWHLMGFGRFFPVDMRRVFYQKIGGARGGAFAIVLIAVLTAWTWLRYPKWKAGARLTALLAGWALIALIIVLHFIPSDISLVGNDRYLYFTAFFQWMLVAVLIARIFRHSLSRNIVFAIVLLVCIGFTARLVIYWRQATKVFWAVQEKFVWKDAPVVLILNMPSNYNGIGIILGRDTSELPDHMLMYGKGRPRGQILDVSSYNMQQASDGAHVVVNDSTHLHVTLNQWGSWWQLVGWGALDRSNALFDLHFLDPGHDYLLTLKQCPHGMVILYQQGEEWRKVDMNRIGVEQR